MMLGHGVPGFQGMLSVRPEKSPVGHLLRYL